MISLSDQGFRGISVAEFFYRNRQMAGFGNPTQAVYSTVRELVENSLDACEDAQVLPKVDVTLTQTPNGSVTITVRDNGPGIPYEFVPEAFGRVLFGSKYDLRQKRGTFGLGVTMAVLYGQLTTNQPVSVVTRYGTAPARSFDIYIDIETNSPVVERTAPCPSHLVGTEVSLTIEGDLKRATPRVREYLRLTSVSTPHALIILSMNDLPRETFGGYSEHIPRPPVIVKPHPRSADVEHLRRLMADHESMSLRTFLVETFQKCGTRTATRFLQFLALSPTRKVSSLSRDEIVRFSAALRNYDGFDRPDDQCLSPIGKEPILDALSELYASSFFKYELRGPFEWQGHPSILEGALVIVNRQMDENPVLYRFANRVPLLYDARDDVLTQAVRKVNWTRYGVNNNTQVLLFVNLCSTRIPYKAAGKQSIAGVSVIESEALLLFKSLGRAINKVSSRAERTRRNRRKMREFLRQFKIIAKFAALLADEESPDITALIHSLFEVDDRD